MIVEIDKKSGFCFGVLNAIGKAEESLKSEDMLYSLGHIVHNELEVKRLQEMGLKTINHDEFFQLKDCKVLIRAHGEPPSTYEYARLNNITLIDASCPVVLKLQQRVKKASEAMNESDGQVVIFGHRGHAEVTGLVGQTEEKAILIENPEDYHQIDLLRPLVVFSQTTKSVDDFKKLNENIKNHAQTNSVEFHDTICRQVSNRVPHLQDFASRFELIIFVGGRHSSNAHVLFDVCKKQNERSYFVSSADDLQANWFSGVSRVGVCGATSTPQWLMEKVAGKLKQF
ncbi:4-hydroxy-3-methylbut-2-enyl diphosphate reductase [Aquipluma nitroreducens]|uniref:4-hydroxy-3-methylbut-2-enyl diphosphate reductase n=1 Tax=Aquipluma nitroreducens TaxID=2010828 RepID=A0A5K7SGS9_9BACT|nr:4-hydroxy-3-methylbut-2-enyl diphosphate reductase [Aquipluma nitroreducens]BBE20637.1 4-hydroxy-3-methylbut-2-enyl diphosphate reductase [Aquipluma nitroreducens]